MLERLQQAARAEAKSFEVLRSLCDEVGPRFPCTPGDVAAQAWAEATMRAAGMRNVRREIAEATLWERGVEACELRLPRPQPVVLSALGGSVGTDANGIEAPVVMFTSLDELEKADRDFESEKTADG